MADHRIIDRPARAQRAATPVDTHVDIPAVCTELVRAEWQAGAGRVRRDHRRELPTGDPGARRGARDRRGPTVLGGQGLTVPGWMPALGRDRRTRDMNEIAGRG
jgi:hypothetical protein